jgi:hypothetical protein
MPAGPQAVAEQELQTPLPKGLSQQHQNDPTAKTNKIPRRRGLVGSRLRRDYGLSAFRPNDSPFKTRWARMARHWYSRARHNHDKSCSHQSLYKQLFKYMLFTCVNPIGENDLPVVSLLMKRNQQSCF